MAERIPKQETDSSNTPESNQAELLAASKAYEERLLRVRGLLSDEAIAPGLDPAQRELLAHCVDVVLSLEGIDMPTNTNEARQGKT